MRPLDFSSASPDGSHHRLHAPRLVLSRHVHLEHHGDHPAGRANAWVANAVGGLLGNMWFFWFCALLDAAALVFGNPASWPVGTWVAFVSQTVIQLLALPVLGVMANIQQKASDARAEADHATLAALHAINVRQLEILERQGAILADLGRLRPGG